MVPYDLPLSLKASAAFSVSLVLSLGQSARALPLLRGPFPR